MAFEVSGEGIIVSRVFDAPVELVWRAWSVPEQVFRWWGPKGYSSHGNMVNFWVGGKYLFGMHSPEGKDFWSTGVYKEIVPLMRIDASESFADPEGNVVPGTYYGMSPDFALERKLTITFEEEGGRTKLILQEVGVPKGMLTELAVQGWNESFDKMAENFKSDLSKTVLIAEPGMQEMVVMRLFDVPRETVFRAYTDQNMIPSWWGPERYTTAIDKLDARKGGTWGFTQSDSEGNEHSFNGVYHDVTPPERIVQTFEYEEKPGHEFFEIVTFDDYNGKTMLVDKSIFQNVADRDGMLSDGMRQGATVSMDRLAELLLKHKKYK